MNNVREVPTAMLATLVQDATRHRLPMLVIGALVAVGLLALLVLAVRRLARRLPAGTPWWYYLGAVGGLAVSLNTSWRFFGERLGITGVERVIMFSVVEVALIACALGMRANVRRIDPATGRPGPAGAPRLVAWALCGLSGYAALLLSGPIDGIARVTLGPILSLVMLHLALGIEIRNRTTVRASAWARVAAELRERALSRLGLSDDTRDAATRTRERATARAAKLALSTRAPWRTTRLARALRAAQIAHDPLARDRLLAELAVLRSANDLATVPLTSPWLPESPPTTATSTPSGPTNGTTSTPGTPASPTGDAETTPGRAAATDQHNSAAPATSPTTTTHDEPMLIPPASEATYANGVLDSVVLIADAEDTNTPWSDEPTKSTAIDRADQLLPGRNPRALVAALSQVGISVAESTVRRRRAQRPPLPEQGQARTNPSAARRAKTATMR